MFQKLKKVVVTILLSIIFIISLYPWLLENSVPQVLASTYQIVAIGDSQTNNPSSYADVLKITPGYTVKKYAKDGRKLSEMDQLLETGTAPDLNKQGIGQDTTHVIIWGGGNDLSAGRSVQQAKESLESIIRKIKAINPSINIIVCYVTPVAPTQSTAAVRNPKVPQLNAAIQGLKDVYKTIDTVSVITKSDGTLNLDYIKTDGLHVNAEGHKLIAAKMLNEVFTSTVTQYNIVALGDSLTAANHSYANHLASLPGVKVDRYAEGGRKALRLLELLNQPVKNSSGVFSDNGDPGGVLSSHVGHLGKEAITKDTTHVMVWIGTNDIDVSEPQKIYETIEAIAKKVDTLYKENGGKGTLKIGIFHITPVGAEYKPDPKKHNDAVKVLNNKINLTNPNVLNSSIQKVDIYSLAADGLGNMKPDYAKWDSEHLHFSPEVQKIFAQKVAKDILGISDSTILNGMKPATTNTGISTPGSSVGVNGSENSGSSGEGNNLSSSGGTSLDLNAVQLGGKIPIGEFGSQIENSNASYFFVYLIKVFRWVAGIVGVFGVLMVVVGGLQIAVSRGNTGLVDAGTKRISGAVVGIVLLFTSSIILITINPQFYKTEGGISLTYVSSSGVTQTFSPPTDLSIGNGDKKNSEKVWSTYQSAIVSFSPDEKDDFHRLVATVATIESAGGRTYAGNDGSALGLMQFIDSTANGKTYKEIFENVYGMSQRMDTNAKTEIYDGWGCLKQNIPQYISLDSKAYLSNGTTEDGRCNPFKSLKAGTALLQENYRYFKTKTDAIRLSIMAYNAGAGNVQELIKKSGKTDPTFEELLPYVTQEWTKSKFATATGDKVREINNYTPKIYALWQHIKSL